MMKRLVLCLALVSVAMVSSAQAGLLRRGGGCPGGKCSVPAKAPAQAPVQAPAKAPAQAPAKAPAQAPAKAPAQAPAQAPAK